MELVRYTMHCPRGRGRWVAAEEGLIRERWVRFSDQLLNTKSVKLNRSIADGLTQNKARLPHLGLSPRAYDGQWEGGGTAAKLHS